MIILDESTWDTSISEIFYKLVREAPLPKEKELDEYVKKTRKKYEEKV